MRTSIRSSVWKQARRTVIGAVAMVPLAASAVLLAAPGASADGTTIAGTLGAAGPANSVGGFGVLALGGAPTAGLNCTANIVIGNVGVGGPGTFTNPKSCVVKGNVYLASTVTESGTGTVSGVTKTDDALLKRAVSDAQSASSAFAGMPATDTKVTSISGGSQTFTATRSGINVVDLSSLTGGPVLKFSCGSFKGCQWVVNDAGAFQFGPGIVTLGSGMTSSDVLFNVYSHGASITFKPAIGNGIFLAPYSSWSMNVGTWNGELIGGLKGTITLKAELITAPIPVIEVPISGWTGAVTALVLLGAGLAGAQWFSRRRRTRVVA
jgi:choice-of-anchor A domain-containing protein